MGLLLVSPAIIVPGGLDRFVFGKLLVAAVGAAIAATVPATGRLTSTVRWLLAAAAGLTLVAAVASDSPVAALFGRQPISEGVFVLAVYLLAGVMGARLLGPGRTPRIERVAVATMAWCMIAVAGLAVVESLGGRPLSSSLDRPGSLLGNASDQGVVGVLYAAPLLVAALRRRRVLEVVGVIAAAAAVVLSASRGALVGLAVALLIVAVLSAKRARPTALALLVAAAAFAFAVPFTRDRILAATPLAAQTVGGRGLLWSESLSLFREQPWLGVGPSGFAQAIAGQHDLRWHRTVGPANPPGTPHNWVLQLLLVGGPLLLVVVLVIAGLTVRGALMTRRAEPTWPVGLVAGLAGASAAFMFHFPAPGTAVPAAIFGGSLLAVAAGPRRPYEVVMRSATIAVAVAIAAVFALAAMAELYLKSGVQAVTARNYAAADRAFGSARNLRIWDVDLPFQAMHQFVAASQAGQSQALPYATKWAARLGPVKNDEQVAPNRAALLELTGRSRSALALLDPVVRKDPHNPQLLLLRGIIRAKVSEFSGALTDLRAVTTVDIQNPEPWRVMAIVYQKLGKTAESAKAEAKYRELS